MRLDLLLVNAPSRLAVYQKLHNVAAIEPPVWAGLIATYCLRHGFSVEILDAEALGLNIEDTAIEIMARNPRLAAFCIYGQQPSASTQCLPAASAVARIITETERTCDDPSVGYLVARPLTLALGTHPSALPIRTLYEEPFDFVCRGEGPRVITHLVSGAERDPGIVPGLYERGDHGTPWKTATNIEDLDHDLPYQAWELLDMKRYRAHNWHLWTGDPTGGYASVQTSLGCPFRCTFCCINAPFGGPGIRYWSPANVARQISVLVNTYGITNIKIPDEMFVLNRQHVWQICNHLIDMKLGEKLNIWAYARVDTLKDEQLLAQMRRAGFRWLGIGIESGSKHVRDGVDKGKFGEEAILAAISRVRAAGIHVGANYIFGLPDDTQETMEATLRLACDLNTEWANFYCAMAYPGSPLHAIAKQKGWTLPEDTAAGWLGYSQHAYDTLPLPTDTLTAEQVLDFRDNAFLHYFSRPEYRSMLRATFGDGVIPELDKMLSYGKPKRKHRDAREGDAGITV